MVSNIKKLDKLDASVDVKDFTVSYEDSSDINLPNISRRLFINKLKGDKINFNRIVPKQNNFNRQYYEF